MAQVVGRDPDSDLALLKISLKRLPVMPFGHSDRLQVGDVVLAIGNPLGLSQTVTHGIVSATGRGQLGLATFENFIQTDAAINPGNSGGALINTRGELVGINTAIVAKTTGAEGIGFAIPVNMVRGVMHDLIASGKVVRGWIGIIPEDFSNEQAAAYGLTRGGVVLVDLYVPQPGTRRRPAPRDILTAVDGKNVERAQDVMALIASARPGATIKVTGVRAGSAFQASIPVRQHPRDLERGALNGPSHTAALPGPRTAAVSRRGHPAAGPDGHRRRPSSGHAFRWQHPDSRLRGTREARADPGVRAGAAVLR